MWNAHTRAAVRLEEPGTVKLFYNHCLADDGAMAVAMGKAWGLPVPEVLSVEGRHDRRGGDDTPPEERTRPEHFDRSYYLENRYTETLIERLTSEERALYCAHIDWDLFLEVITEWDPHPRPMPFLPRVYFLNAWYIEKLLICHKEKTGDDLHAAFSPAPPGSAPGGPPP
jgi:hypothetical protein